MIIYLKLVLKVGNGLAKLLVLYKRIDGLRVLSFGNGPRRLLKIGHLYFLFEMALRGPGVCLVAAEKNVNLGRVGSECRRGTHPRLTIDTASLLY